ncbi:helix-turn-helix domain-containing protein [Lentilactobacillus parabuchneri]|uniref:helix-turn-helix domain-containing protein n=1 Tax=Lentilactobacillus parabuchneri TaxID=152331 RepID=UPI003A5C45F0
MIHDTKNVGKPTVLTCRFPTFYGCLLHKDVTLEKLAAKYDYNRNYLSNLFKREVGDTFSNVLTKQRLMKANILITSTNLPVSKIIKEVGIKNRTFFYKKYISLYKVAPSSSRKETLR